MCPKILCRRYVHFSYNPVIITIIIRYIILQFHVTLWTRSMILKPIAMKYNVIWLADRQTYAIHPTFIMARKKSRKCLNQDGLLEYIHIIVALRHYIINSQTHVSLLNHNDSSVFYRFFNIFRSQNVATDFNRNDASLRFCFACNLERDYANTLMSP